MYRFAPLIIFAGLLAACSSADDMEKELLSEQQPNAQAPAAPASPESLDGAKSVSEKNDLYFFDYSYPQAAGSLAGLRAVLDAKLKRDRAELEKFAREDQQAAQKNDFSYRAHSLSVKWEVAADIPRFLSLTGDVATYGGGAHGNYGKESLVWDKRTNTALEGLRMFASAQALQRAIAPRYCAELNRLREQRRGQPVDPEQGSTFSECPPVEELTVIMGSSNGKTFDRVGFYAAPYIAGAYAEGDFEITLPVDGPMMAALRPVYRSAFSIMR